MNEKDVKLLSSTGHWQSATVKYAPEERSWLIELNTVENDEQHILTLKSGTPRFFKTSDAALNWCRDIGIRKITVKLHKLPLAQDTESKTASVLLIEDDANDIELTLKAIQRLDIQFDMTVCRDGQEALDFLFARGKFKNRNTSEIPELILLDLKLPKLSGHEVLRSIRENPASRFIPVVILSTSDEEIDISKGYALGINSYVRKSIDYDAFCDTIKELGHYWLCTNKPPPIAISKNGQQI
jgi:two-component system response regulator